MDAIAFSPLRFLSDANDSKEKEDFIAITEEMKQYLIEPKQSLKMDRTSYNDLLNRAVLGFPDARMRVMAMLHDELVKRDLHHVPPPHQKYDSLAEAIFAEIMGMHVLELVMKDRNELEEVQVVGTKIYEVRAGKTMESPYRFQSIKEVERIQYNLVLFNQAVLSPRKRWAEVMLIDGSRVTMTGFGFTALPTLTIRFYPLRNYSLQSLLLPESGTISERVMHLLLAVIHSCMNIVIIGATNSGKTHLLKCMIAEMPDEERIVTIESRLELLLHRDFPNKNIIEYEVEEEGEGEHTAARAFKLALRQSPKRIIHAEIRDEDANMYVRACTRGHDGSMTTVHASALEDVPDVIADMCMLDRRGMNPERLRKRIVEYVTQIGIHMAQLNGKRRVARMVEFAWEEDRVATRELAVYDPGKDDWNYPRKPSPKTARRIRRYAPKYHDLLASEGKIA